MNRCKDCIWRFKRYGCTNLTRLAQDFGKSTVPIGVKGSDKACKYFKKGEKTNAGSKV